MRTTIARKAAATPLIICILQLANMLSQETIHLIYQVLLYAHIAAGATALLSGLVAFLTNKGKKVHKRSGKVFFWAMMAISFTALLISLYKSNGFLLAVAVFSFYMNYTGLRVLKYKKGKFKWFDWIPLGISAVLVLYMFYTLDIRLIVFGALLTFFIYQDIARQLKGEEDKKLIAKQKIIDHLGRMSGTYIGTFTAFLVVNIHFIQPGWIVWLAPTFIGVPIIIYYIRVWKKKLGIE